MRAGTRARASASTGPVSDPTCVNMPRTVGARGPRHTARTEPRGLDVVAAAVGLAHADAERGHTAAEVARRYSTAGRKASRRRANEWTRVGPPELREITSYLLVVSNPYRIEASIRTTVKQRAIGKLSTPALIERYHELLELEPTVEAQDRLGEVVRGMPWVERAALSERNAAVDAEKAACEREFAARGITERDVFEGRAD